MRVASVFIDQLYLLFIAGSEPDSFDRGNRDGGRGGDDRGSRFGDRDNRSGNRDGGRSGGPEDEGPWRRNTGGAAVGFDRCALEII